MALLWRIGRAWTEGRASRVESPADAWGPALLMLALAVPFLLPWYVAWFVPFLGLTAGLGDGGRSAARELNPGLTMNVSPRLQSASISQIKDRDAYLKAKADSQFAVPEDQLVEGVRQVLDRHDMKWE